MKRMPITLLGISAFLVLHLVAGTAADVSGSGMANCPTFVDGASLGTAVPAELILTVRETAGIARSSEVVRSGVPLPRSLDVRDTNALTLVDAGGTPVPAEFQALARWNAGREDTSAPIQWLLVAFPASVAANGSTTYRLVTDRSAGPNPTPPVTPALSVV